MNTSTKILLLSLMLIGCFVLPQFTPAVEGEYEVKTIIEYQKLDLPAKELNLIIVIDPEGYVYRQLTEGKLRTQGAKVTLSKLNEKSKQYELWPAGQYAQKNPQYTNDTGKYAFLVPEGKYQIKVEADHYFAYQNTFDVSQNHNVHMNIELKRKTWWQELWGR